MVCWHSKLNIPKLNEFDGGENQSDAPEDFGV